MTPEEIIEMARQAGFSFSEGIVTGGVTDVKRFAALVRADEREVLAQLAPYMAVSTDRMSVDPHTGNVSIGTVAQPAPAQKRPQNCGTGYCSCVECVMEPAAPVQEPVAWMQSDEVHISLWKDDYHTIPLYTTPPAQRTWVGLTQEEKDSWVDAMPDHVQPWHLMNLVNVIETKLWSKNENL